MILLIFNKLKRNRGAVEIYESTFIFPIIFLLIASLFIFSISIIDSSIRYEKVYLKSRNLLNSENHEVLIDNKKISKSKGFFKDTAIVSEESKNLVYTIKNNNVKINRTIKFLKYFFTDINEIEFGKYRISDIINNISE